MVFGIYPGGIAGTGTGLTTGKPDDVNDLLTCVR
jgi:hypothetical protein